MIKKFPNNSVKEFYDCTEEIAEVLDKYFGREHGPVNDMSDINTFVEEYANGWGISARSYGEDEVSRENQQEKQEELQEPYSRAINSMFDLDDEGAIVDDTVLSVTLPDGSETTPGALEDVTHYSVKCLSIKSNDQGGLTTSDDSVTGDEFQLVYNSPYFGNDKTYASPAMKSITLEKVLECMNEAMKVTQDYHHCFVENLRYTETYCQGSENQFPGCHILEIITGS
tara:strand:- start:369 stop:1049 length:681 start_codon:yes stop_codon:yes gene_type:complete